MAEYFAKPDNAEEKMSWTLCKEEKSSTQKSKRKKVNSLPHFRFRNSLSLPRRLVFRPDSGLMNFRGSNI
jgi:hypothetical protein